MMLDNEQSKTLHCVLPPQSVSFRYLARNGVRTSRTRAKCTKCSDSLKGTVCEITVTHCQRHVLVKMLRRVDCVCVCIYKKRERETLEYQSYALTNGFPNNKTSSSLTSVITCAIHKRSRARVHTHTQCHTIREALI